LLEESIARLGDKSIVTTVALAGCEWNVMMMANLTKKKVKCLRIRNFFCLMSCDTGFYVQ
jgi:hypothetical protein